MLDGMTKRFDKTLNKIKNEKTITEEKFTEIVRELKINLLDADVNIKVTKKFLFQISQKIKGKMVEQGKTVSQEIIKIVQEELTEILGKSKKSIVLSTKPGTLMMVGLQGSGKTTTVAKLANYLLKKNKSHKNPLLVACDIYRPAAIDQLEKLAKDIKVDIYLDRKEKNVNKIAEAAIKQATQNNNDLIIFDTAGRLHIDEKLMEELVLLKKLIKPEEIILTIDAMSGQDIINVADEFNNKLKITGTIITKFDSDARVGAALSITELINVPIKLIGVGEQIENIELFYPDRIASRILGLGDIESLVEKVKDTGSESAQEKIYRRILSGKYDLVDLLTSMQEMKKIGSMSSIMKMIPGMSKLNKAPDDIEEKLVLYESLLNSMTQKEKRNPKLLNHPKRKERILKGSGRNLTEYNQLIRQFQQSKKQIDQLAKLMKTGKTPNLKNIASGNSGNPFGQLK